MRGVTFDTYTLRFDPFLVLGVSSTGTAPLTRVLQDSDKALILSSFNSWRQDKRLQLSFLQQLITLY